MSYEFQYLSHEMRIWIYVSLESQREDYISYLSKLYSATQKKNNNRAKFNAKYLLYYMKKL